MWPLSLSLSLSLSLQTENLKSKPICISVPFNLSVFFLDGLFLFPLQNDWSAQPRSICVTQFRKWFFHSLWWFFYLHRIFGGFRFFREKKKWFFPFRLGWFYFLCFSRWIKPVLNFSQRKHIQTYIPLHTGKSVCVFSTKSFGHGKIKSLFILFLSVCVCYN